MPDLRSLPRTRYGASECPDPYQVRGNSVGNHLRLGPGFHREPWIPAFAGMTPFGNREFMDRH